MGSMPPAWPSTLHFARAAQIATMSATAPPPYSYNTLPQEETAHAEVDPDDFKVGVTVEQSAPEIRAMFVRKVRTALVLRQVYSVLFCQILGSAVVATALNASVASAWIQSNAWIMLVALVGSFVSLGLVYWKRHTHPTNLVMLGLFTAFESLSLGALISFMDQSVVLKAFVVTTFVFLGLTLFTLQSEYDFSSMGAWLYWALLLLVGTGLVQMFFPYNHMFELAYSAGGCAVFSGYIVYDTWLLQRHLSPDDWVLANVSLYLDVVNLFLSILRLMNSSDE